MNRAECNSKEWHSSLKPPKNPTENDEDEDEEEEETEAEEERLYQAGIAPESVEGYSYSPAAENPLQISATNEQEPVNRDPELESEEQEIPKPTTIYEEDEDDEEETQKRTQKRKSLSCLGSEPATAAKKPKKKNNVWTKSSSRKGKKKNKSNANGAEETVFITPVPRFPDKSDDSRDMKICLSKVYKAEKVELSDDRLSASSCKGYRMVRATRGVVDGAWYFEIKALMLGDSAHTRLGWSTEKGDLQAPVGYDGNSFAYRDIEGSKVHKAVRESYGDSYFEGDVIGCYINLPEGSFYAPKPPHLVWYKGQRYAYAAEVKEDPPKVIPGE